MIKSRMILNNYGAEEAEKLLVRTDRKINIVGVDEVFYPYLLLWYSVFVGKGRLSKLNKHYNCVVDGVSGSVYEGDGTPTMVDVEIDEHRSLPFRITAEECRRIGHDFVMKQFLGKAKLLMAPSIQVIKEEAFYKRFYIMHCLDDNAQDYFIMVDAIDGGLSVLDC